MKFARNALAPLLAEDIDDILTDENVDQCDLILLAVYPEAAIE